MPKAAKPKKETGTRKRKEKKDKNAPKRPLQPFMFFCQEQRDIVKRDNPEATFTQIGRLLGDKWKGLNEKEKEKYIKSTENDKKRYEREMESYEAPED